MRNRIIICSAIALIFLAITPVVSMTFQQPSPANIRPVLLRNMPHPNPALLTFSIWRTAPLEVAKVYGRSPGCSDADAEMINTTAKAAIETNVDPAILAALVATESSCNPYAVSSRGAVGLTQIMLKVWSSKFDFGHDVNLFNRYDSLHTGALILADNISHYGTQAGIRRYNGTGTDCLACDDQYTNKILALAHK